MLTRKTVDLFMELLELKYRAGTFEIVYVKYPVEGLQFALFYVLRNSKSAGVPLSNVSDTMVRFTIRCRLILIFLNRSWKAIVGSISSLNFSFCLG